MDVWNRFGKHRVRTILVSFAAQRCAKKVSHLLRRLFISGLSLLRFPVIENVFATCNAAGCMHAWHHAAHFAASFIIDLTMYLPVESLCLEYLLVAVAEKLVLVCSTTAVAVAASASLVNGLVSLCLQLDLHWPLAIATCRWALIIQLGCMITPHA